MNQTVHVINDGRSLLRPNLRKSTHMKITGHKASSMFKRYADLFGDEEKRTQQRAVQSKRREWRKAHADNVVATPKQAAIQ